LALVLLAFRSRLWIRASGSVTIDLFGNKMGNKP
jgi:hypothetical protein